MLLDLGREFPYLWSDLAAADSFTALSPTDPPCGIVRTEGGAGTGSVSLVAGDEAGIAGFVQAETREACEWAAGRLQDLAADDTDVSARVTSSSSAGLEPLPSDGLPARLRTEGFDDSSELAAHQLEYARVLLASGDPASASGRARQARETADSIEAAHLRCRTDLLLGRIAAAEGSPAEALDHWREALPRFEAAGAPQDVLSTLDRLVETSVSAGNDESARKWHQRADAVLAEAPGPVAAQHVDWVEARPADLEAD